MKTPARQSHSGGDFLSASQNKYVTICFDKWLEGAREWAVSRARYWGAALPVWKCKECDALKIVGSLKELAEGKKANNTYYVMRHGQSESNVAGIIDCDGDHTNNVTEKGAEQARVAGEALKDKNIDLIQYPANLKHSLPHIPG